MRKCNYFCKRNNKGNTLKKTKFVLFVWIMTAFIMQVSASSSLTVYPAASLVDFYQGDKYILLPQFGVKEDDIAYNILNELLTLASMIGNFHYLPTFVISIAIFIIFYCFDINT